jgi:O-antigen/teichoic acid export membrane protein
VLALLPREAAYATGRAGGVRQASELPLVIGRTARIVLWQMPLIVVATLLAWWYLPASWRALQLPLAVLLAAFVLTYPLRIFQATLQGLQDLTFVGALQLAAWTAGTALTVALVLKGWRLPALAAGAMVTQLVLLGGCAYRVATRFGAALPRRLPPLAWRDAVGYIRRAGWVSISQVAQVLLYSTDMLVVAWIFGPVTVVPYACTQKLISVLANQPQVLTQAAAPALSELRMGASREKLFTVTSALSLALMLVSGAVLTVVLAVNRAFVSWWVGPDQYGGAVLTGLFAVSMLVRHLNVALVYSLFSFGHERRLSITTVADGAVTLILSLTLARVIGVAGVPLGFLGGALLVSIPANLTALARETGVSPAHFALELKPWALRLAVLLPVSAALNVLVTSGRFVTVAAAALLMGVAYLVLLLPVALRPPLGGYVRPVLARMFPFLGIAERADAAPVVALSHPQGPLV